MERGDHLHDRKATPPRKNTKLGKGKKKENQKQVYVKMSRSLPCSIGDPNMGMKRVTSAPQRRYRITLREGEQQHYWR